MFLVEVESTGGLSFLIYCLLRTVLDELDRSEGNETRCSNTPWQFIEKIPTKMYGSGEKHVCWIFRRC